MLSVKQPLIPRPTPLFLMENIKMNGIPTKIEWKIHALFFIVEGTSADFIFHKLLELCSTLCEKKDFRHKFSFCNGFIPFSGFSKCNNTHKRIMLQKLFGSSFAPRFPGLSACIGLKILYFANFLLERWKC